jgi:hypothetical protein
VCKALDENFRRVDCTLWPKRLGTAPESTDTVPPVWSSPGGQVRAQWESGRVLLRFGPATDNEDLYGYEVFRAEGEGPWEHRASLRASSQRFEDAHVLPGETYRYSLRPYDLAGNRGPRSEEVAVTVPHEAVALAPLTHLPLAKDPTAIEGCAAVTGG